MRQPTYHEMFAFASAHPFRGKVVVMGNAGLCRNMFAMLPCSPLLAFSKSHVVLLSDGVTDASITKLSRIRRDAVLALTVTHGVARYEFAKQH